MSTLKLGAYLRSVFFCRQNRCSVVFNKMGIDLCVKQEILEHWAPSSSVSTSYVHTKMAAAGGNHVIIEDMLTRVAHSTGPNHNHLCTTLEFYKFVIAPIKQAFDQYNARVYVMSFDDEANKSHRKAKTQQLRAQAAKKADPEVTKYPQTYTGFRVDGVYNSTTDETELIDIRRLARSKFLFPILWKYILDLLRTESFLSEDHLIVFEYEATGPVLIPSERAWPEGIPIPASLVHNHSEGDPSSAFWTRIFNPLSCVICSIDTDLIPILCILEGRESLAHSENPETEGQARRDIYWSYSAERSVNIPMMVRHVTKSTGLTAFQFAMFCILCDTDYVAKSIYAHNFGCLAILNAVRKRQDDLQKLVEAAFMTTNDDVRRKNDDDVGERASEDVHKYNSSEDPEELRLLRESIAAADALKLATDALDSIMRYLYSIGRAQHINEDMRALRPTKVIVVAPAAVVGAVKADEGSKKKAKTKMFDSKVSESALPFWSELAKKYASKKAFKLPSRKDLQMSADCILWNFRMWQSQAI
jgi:hypothetical protein